MAASKGTLFCSSLALGFSAVRCCAVLAGACCFRSALLRIQPDTFLSCLLLLLSGARILLPCAAPQRRTAVPPRSSAAFLFLSCCGAGSSDDFVMLSRALLCLQPGSFLSCLRSSKTGQAVMLADLSAYRVGVTVNIAPAYDGQSMTWFSFRGAISDNLK